MGLSREESNPAYRLGRLFAVYESVQRAALGKVNATIKDRYFGAASATPASVFPLLERNSASHLASLRKGEKGGLAHWFDAEIDGDPGWHGYGLSAESAPRGSGAVRYRIPSPEGNETEGRE